MKKKNLKRSALWRLLFQGKVFFINPAFQTRFMASVLFCVVLSLSVVYASQQYFFHVFQEKGQELGLAADHVFFALLQEQQIQMLNIFIVSSLCLCLVIGFWALFYSHRIAGPLHRLNRYFSDGLNKGPEPLPPLAFRDDDFFRELPESINQYLSYRHSADKTDQSKH